MNGNPSPQLRIDKIIGKVVVNGTEINQPQDIPASAVLLLRKDSECSIKCADQIVAQAARPSLNPLKESQFNTSFASFTIIRTLFPSATFLNKKGNKYEVGTNAGSVFIIAP